MKALNMVKVAFDTHIHSKEIAAFQAAWTQRVGTAELSKNQMPGYYPLVQYKTRRSYDQQQPLVVILGKHPKLFQRLNQHGEWEANLNGRKIQMKIAHARANQYQLQLKRQMLPFTIFNYQALCTQHYRQYQQCTTQTNKLDYLAYVLHHHLLNFARGVDWQPKGELKVEVTRILREKTIPYQGIKAHCFDLQFRVNAFLPEYIGLGRGLRKGFGTVRKS